MILNARNSYILFSYLLLAVQTVVSSDLHAATVAPLPEGTTTISFSDELIGALSGAGIQVEPIGQASLTGALPTAAFPITRGFARGKGFLLRHQDSGLKFSSQSDPMFRSQPAVELSVGNFTIIGNDAGSHLFGQAFGVNEREPFYFPCCAPLFNIDSELTVTFTNVAAFGFSILFDLDFDALRAIDVGTAKVQFVPLPSALLLLGSAAVGLGFVGRRGAADEGGDICNSSELS